MDIEKTARHFDLTGKVILVTGGTRGLGLAMARAFAEAGADLDISSRKAEACLAVARAIREELGVRCIGVPCHVADWNDCDALVGAAYAALNRLFFWNTFDAAALLAVLSGIAWAATAAASLRLVRDDGNRETADTAVEKGRAGWTLAAVLAGGYSAVFFGGAAAPALGTAAAGLFIVVSLLHIRGRVPLLVPGLTLLLAVGATAGTVFLAGGFLVLLIGCLADRTRRAEAIPALLAIALVAIAAELAVRAFAGAGTAGRLALSLRAAIDAARSDGAAAALAPVNIVLAAGPAAVLGLVLLVRTAGRREDRSGAAWRFLGVTALCAVLLAVVAGTKARGGLRADLFAPVGAVLAFYGIASLGRSPGMRGRLVPAAVLLTALGLYHLAPFVAVDASLGLGQRRVLALPLPQGKAEHLIGAQAMHDRDWKVAAEWLGEASRKDPRNASILYELGRADMRLDEPLDAISQFARALRIEPHRTSYRAWLAEAFIANQWYEEASAQLDTLTRAYPDSARLWTRLGFARNHGRMFAGAVEAYERALRLDPDNEEYERNLTSALLNRGVELQESGDYDGARAMYRRARVAYPLDWVSQNNLAVLEMDQGNWERAHSILSQALTEHPHIPQLHYNMSRVNDHFGEYGEALYHVRRGIQLDRFGTPPVEEVARLQAIVDSLGLDVPSDTAAAPENPAP